VDSLGATLGKGQIWFGILYSLGKFDLAYYTLCNNHRLWSIGAGLGMVFWSLVGSIVRS